MSKDKPPALYYRCAESKNHPREKGTAFQTPLEMVLRDETVLSKSDHCVVVVLAAGAASAFSG